MNPKLKIQIEAEIHVPIELVWDSFTNPRRVTHWNHASPDWHTPWAKSDFKVGGKFIYRMESRDGSIGFDFSGVFTLIKQNEHIEYMLDDGRLVKVIFAAGSTSTKITEIFEAESENTPELQQQGWQAILDNFKAYTENAGTLHTLHFDIAIEANVSKVYTTMIQNPGYSEWTSVFNPTSRFEGSWKKGEKMLFIGTDQDGSLAGMVSRIVENTPNTFVSIEHLGFIKAGEEILSGKEVDDWKGALENYSFSEENGQTFVKVDLDSKMAYFDYFNETWPAALKKLKELCENLD